MGAITTYVCDVSGVALSAENKDLFVEVEIRVTDPRRAYNKTSSVRKLVHIDVAKRLHLIDLNKEEKEVLSEPTLESKLTILMRDYISELAIEAAEEAVSNILANRA